MVKSRRQEMTTEALQLLAARFKVLAEPLRLRILHTLKGGEMSVNDLTETVEAFQPNVSKHLKTLQEAGFVARRQEGNNVYYSIADRTVFDLCELMCDSLQQRLTAQAGVFTVMPLRSIKRRV
jgi:DNA-binding transcriptional ArsR family regulator